MEADADRIITLRPIIDEIARTGILPSTVTLLVDHVSIVRNLGAAQSKRGQAFRLWMSDGCKSIQAVLKRELHPYLAVGSIREGSYVEITKYKLATVQRLSNESLIYVLQIMDLTSIGHDGRVSGSDQLDMSKNPRLISEDEEQPHVQTRSDLQGVSNTSWHNVDTHGPTSLNKQKSPRPSSQVACEVQQAQQAHNDSNISPSMVSESEEIILVSNQGSHGEIVTNDGENRSKEAVLLGKRKRGLSSSVPGAINEDDASRPTKKFEPEKPSSPLEGTTIPLIEKDISRPLRITPLSRIIGPRTVRNRVYDVLGVVCHVDEQTIHRRGMPEQRNLRIMDQSVTRDVQLTVFVNAAQFQPKIGTVAVFRNVTTHEWNGGSLKAYQRDCSGVKWFIPNPTMVNPTLLSLLRHCWENGHALQRGEHCRDPPPPD